MADEIGNQELDAELSFLSAMQAYRAARASGDAKATGEAEDAWRELVRAELMGQSKTDHNDS